MSQEAERPLTNRSSASAEKLSVGQQNSGVVAAWSLPLELGVDKNPFLGMSQDQIQKLDAVLSSEQAKQILSDVSKLDDVFGNDENKEALNPELDRTIEDSLNYLMTVSQLAELPKSEDFLQVFGTSNEVLSAPGPAGLPKDILEDDIIPLLDHSYFESVIWLDHCYSIRPLPPSPPSPPKVETLHDVEVAAEEVAEEVVEHAENDENEEEFDEDEDDESLGERKERARLGDKNGHSQQSPVRRSQRQIEKSEREQLEKIRAENAEMQRREREEMEKRRSNNHTKFADELEPPSENEIAPVSDEVEEPPVVVRLPSPPPPVVEQPEKETSEDTETEESLAIMMERHLKKAEPEDATVVPKGRGRGRGRGRGKVMNDDRKTPGRGRSKPKKDDDSPPSVGRGRGARKGRGNAIAGKKGKGQQSSPEEKMEPKPDFAHVDDEGNLDEDGDDDGDDKRKSLILRLSESEDEETTPPAAPKGKKFKKAGAVSEDDQPKPLTPQQRKGKKAKRAKSLDSDGIKALLSESVDADGKASGNEALSSDPNLTSLEGSPVKAVTRRRKVVRGKKGAIGDLGVKGKRKLQKGVSPQKMKMSVPGGKKIRKDAASRTKTKKRQDSGSDSAILKELEKDGVKKEKPSSESEPENKSPVKKVKEEMVRKTYPKRENRKPPAFLVQTIFEPALFSTPDIMKKVDLKPEPKTPDSASKAEKILEDHFENSASVVDSSVAPPVENVEELAVPSCHIEEAVQRITDGGMCEVESQLAKMEEPNEDELASVTAAVQSDTVSAVEAEMKTETPEPIIAPETPLTQVPAVSSNQGEVEGSQGTMPIISIAPKKNVDPRLSENRDNILKLDTPKKILQGLERLINSAEPKKPKVVPVVEKKKEGPARRIRTKKRKAKQANIPAAPIRNENIGNAVDDSDYSYSDDLDDSDWCSEDDPERLWCICKQPHDDRFMINCDNCHEWFHGNCVGITRKMGKEIEKTKREWTCPKCSKDKSLVKEVKSEDVVHKKDSRTEERMTFKKEIKSEERHVKKEISPMKEIRLIEPRPMPKPPVEEKLPSEKKKVMKPMRPVNTVAREKPASVAQQCIVRCGKLARPDSIYCSSECIQKHACESLQMLNKLGKGKTGEPRKDDGARVIVMERCSGKILTGPNAPTEGNLKNWLREHPTFEVLRPGTALPSSKFYSSLPPPERERKDVVKRPAALPQQTPPRPVEKEVKAAPPTPTTPAPPPGPEPIRLNVRKTLRDILTSRNKDDDDVVLSQEEIKKIVLSIEEELFRLFGDTGFKYKAKYRSLMFNIKDPKNHGLFRKILKGKISPTKLVRMTPEELASKELAMWRERETKHALEIITREQKDVQVMPILKKTHKGEIEIQEEEVLFNDPISEEKSKPKVEAPLDAVLGGLLVDTTDQHRSHLFDLNCKICTGKMAPPTEAIKKVKVAKSISVDDKSDPSKKKSSKEKPRVTIKDHREVDKKSDRKDKEKEKHSKEMVKDKGKDKVKDKHKDKSREKDKVKEKSKDKERSKEREKEKSREKDKLKEKEKSKEKDRTKEKLKSKDREKIKEKPVEKENVKDKPKIIEREEIVQEITKPDALMTDIKPIESGVIVDKNKDAADREPSSTVDIRSPDSAMPSQSDADSSLFPVTQMSVWKGFINMQDVSKLVAGAYKVSGPPDFLRQVHFDVPDTIQIVGRINPSIVWDYLSKIKQSGTKEFLVIRFQPANEEEKPAYISLYHYLSIRKRFGVVANASKMVKDFYIIPLASHNPVPSILLPFEGPGLEESRPHMLLGVIVRHGGMRRSTPSLSEAVPKATKRKYSGSPDPSFTPPLEKLPTSILKVTVPPKDDGSYTPPLESMPAVKRTAPMPTAIEASDRSYTPPLEKMPRVTFPDEDVVFTDDGADDGAVADDGADSPYSPEKEDALLESSNNNKKDDDDVPYDPEDDDTLLKVEGTTVAAPPLSGLLSGPVSSQSVSELIDQISKSSNPAVVTTTVLASIATATDLDQQRRLLIELTQKVEEQKRQLEMQKQKIAATVGINLKPSQSGLPSTSVPSVAQVQTPVMPTKSNDEDEAYSPSYTPPLQKSGSPCENENPVCQQSSISQLPDASMIALPPNLQKILENIKKAGHDMPTASSSSTPTSQPSSGLATLEDPIVKKFSMDTEAAVSQSAVAEESRSPPSPREDTPSPPPVTENLPMTDKITDPRIRFSIKSKDPRVKLPQMDPRRKTSGGALSSLSVSELMEKARLQLEDAPPQAKLDPLPTVTNAVPVNPIPTSPISTNALPTNSHHMNPVAMNPLPTNPIPSNPVPPNPMPTNQIPTIVSQQPYAPETVNPAPSYAEPPPPGVEDQELGSAPAPHVLPSTMPTIGPPVQQPNVFGCALPPGPITFPPPTHYPPPPVASVSLNTPPPGYVPPGGFPNFSHPPPPFGTYIPPPPSYQEPNKMPQHRHQFPPRGRGRGGWNNGRDRQWHNRHGMETSWHQDMDERRPRDRDDRYHIDRDERSRDRDERRRDYRDRDERERNRDKDYRIHGKDRGHSKEKEKKHGRSRDRSRDRSRGKSHEKERSRHRD